MHNHDFYSVYTVDQFAADEHFQQWVLQADEASDAFWKDFLDAHPGRLKDLLKARRLVELSAHAAYGTSPLTGKEKKALKDNIFSLLDLQASISAPRKAIITKIVLFRAAAAAVFILAVVSFFLVYNNRLGAGSNKSALLAEHTGPNQIKKILLADSTLIILNANSSIQYNPDLSSTREITLKGNAFFNVSKDHGRRPFVVHTGTTDITVLGTTFNVNARSAAAEVVLTSGKVKLTQPGRQSSVLLLPGDKVTLDTMQHVFIRSTVDIPLYTEWMDGKWNFRHNTLEDIAGLITKYYGVTVEFKSEKNKRLRINAVIPVGSLQKLVPVLEQTVHKKMSLTSDTLIIE
ncbi:MAG: hypothetical protein BGO55_31115 [Sphingobacteriales bacterium 50-39]|nr:FecR family protein [Sphingobacteriales bacterium]OJW60964.1 MAG: hypothetical protein BGO55_31115 [Sphingobacteriales bacterium 50-39]